MSGSLFWDTVYKRLIVKFDLYRNLQRHRAVLPAIARLSCYHSVLSIPIDHCKSTSTLFCRIHTLPTVVAVADIAEIGDYSHYSRQCGQGKRSHSTSRILGSLNSRRGTAYYVYGTRLSSCIINAFYVRWHCYTLACQTTYPTYFTKASQAQFIQLCPAQSRANWGRLTAQYSTKWRRDH